MRTPDRRRARSWWDTSERGACPGRLDTATSPDRTGRPSSYPTAGSSSTDSSSHRSPGNEDSAIGQRHVARAERVPRSGDGREVARCWIPDRGLERPGVEVVPVDARAGDQQDLAGAQQGCVHRAYIRRRARHCPQSVGGGTGGSAGPGHEKACGDRRRKAGDNPGPLATSGSVPHTSMRISAICTALSAAPLRRLSPVTHRLSVFGWVGSSRNRPTSTGSIPAPSSAVGAPLP